METVDSMTIKDGTMYIHIPKIINGSLMWIGDTHAKTSLTVDQHFNWFQKLMWKWCFGVTIEDYNEE